MYKLVFNQKRLIPTEVLRKSCTRRGNPTYIAITNKLLKSMDRKTENVIISFVEIVKLLSRNWGEFFCLRFLITIFNFQNKSLTRKNKTSFVDPAWENGVLQLKSVIHT